MNLIAVDGNTSDLLKFGTILFLGTSVGIVTVVYSPVIALSGTIIFTILTIGVYIQAQSQRRIAATVLAEPKSGLIFYLFYLSFFLSMTIPKSGKTISGIPITTANLLIIITLGCWLMTLISSQKRLFSIPLSGSLSLFIVYGFMCLLIGVINRNLYKYVLLDFVAFIGFIPLYFLGCSIIRTKAQVKKIIWAIALSSLLVSVYGILQTRLGFERISVPGITEQSGKIMYQGVGRWNIIEGGASKVYSTFQNGNIFGNHLATFIPFLGGVLIGFASSKKKIMFAGIFLLACYALILTYSRGALFGTIFGIVVFAVISKKIRWRAILVMLLIFSLLFVFLQKYSHRPELVRYDFRRITTEPDRFSAGRIERTKEVIKGFANLPVPVQLFGIGFGGVLVTPSGWRFDYVDNLYLTLLFKMGIVGLLLLMMALMQFFRTLLKLRARTPDLDLRGLINGGIAGLFASLIHNIADTLWFFPPLSANFWFLASITMAIALIGAQPIEVAAQVRSLSSQPTTSRPKFVSV